MKANHSRSKECCTFETCSKRLLALFCLLAVFLFAFHDARAATISGLFNTGSDGVGLLPDETIDPHYTLIAVPVGSGLGPNTYVADETKLPLSNGDWLANGVSSKWIAPAADASSLLEVNQITGQWIYRQSFDLSGYDPSTALITGQWATDNIGLSILLNGANTGNVNTAQFATWTPFTISSGFGPGINTLDFVLENSPFPPGSPSIGESNPTGLRVELTGTVSIPEPSRTLLSLLGLGGMLVRRRR